jgi:NADH:ubiquinone oxidoreductase subunit C
MTAASGELAARMADLLPSGAAKAAFAQSVVTVPLNDWVNAALLARDELGCALFDWLGAEDAGRPGSVGERHTVLLHVVDPSNRNGLLLRTEVGSDEELPSVAHVWAGAAWHEREAAEMFGLALAGPPPAHLLLSETFAGHPLRKDFVLASRVVRPWPGGLEPGESTAAPSRRRLAPPGVPDPSWGPRREEDPS